MNFVAWIGILKVQANIGEHLLNANVQKFPQEWKNKSSLQKLVMLRALRPDRMTYAIRYSDHCAIN